MKELVVLRNCDGSTYISLFCRWSSFRIISSDPFTLIREHENAKQKISFFLSLISTIISVTAFRPRSTLATGVIYAAGINVYNSLRPNNELVTIKHLLRQAISNSIVTMVSVMPSVYVGVRRTLKNICSKLQCTQGCCVYCSFISSPQ